MTDTERVSRFILDKNHFKAGHAKFRAFDPPPAEIALSVSRTEGLSDSQVWDHGDVHVARPSGRQIVARGDFTREDARAVQAGGCQLDIEPEEPPPLHANVIGYPSIEQKELRKSLAQQLVAKVVAVARPSQT